MATTSSEVDRVAAFGAGEYSRVVAAVAATTGNAQDAPDAVQEALLGFLTSPGSSTVTNMAAWITVVASNTVRDGYRSRAAQGRALARVGVPRDDFEDPADLVETDVVRALKRLSPQQRRVCALHYLFDRSVESIATELAVSTGTVKTQLSRARKALTTIVVV